MSFTELPTIQKEELIVSLASLILADGEVAVNKDNLDTLVEKSGNSIAPYWTALFAAHLEGKNVLDMIASGGICFSAAPAAAAAAASTDAAPAEEKKEEEEEEEEEDLGGAAGLFGDDDDDW